MFFKYLIRPDVYIVAYSFMQPITYVVNLICTSDSIERF